MAKKKAKKQEIPTKDITIELSALSSENDSYIGDLAQFLEEKINDLKTERSVNSLIVTIDENYSKRKIRQLLRKFLYLANLHLEYRPVNLQADESGYKIYKKFIEA